MLMHYSTTCGNSEIEPSDTFRLRSVHTKMNVQHKYGVINI